MRNDIAIQLYSLRDISANDYMAALRHVANVGFQNVELAGSYGLSGEELKAVLDELGLKAISSHVPFSADPAYIKEQMAFNRAVGNNTIVCPHSNTGDLEETMQSVKNLKIWQDELEKEGFIFGYHNHANEMKKVDGDKRAIDIIAEEGIKLQPDVFWVKTGGYDPVEFINSYRGQIVSLHFKEYDADGKNVEFGTGILPWQEIMEAGKNAGAAYNILEQEQYTMEVADSIALCAKNLDRMFQ